MSRKLSSPRKSGTIQREKGGRNTCQEVIVTSLLHGRMTTLVFVTLKYELACISEIEIDPLELMLGLCVSYFSLFCDKQGTE